VDLGNFAPPGSNVRLRWDIGIDQCSARKGWYLDNVKVFSCVPKVPVVSVVCPVVSAPEASGALVFSIRLSTPTILPVVVTVETVDGSAGHGNDFDRTVGTVVIPASSATSLVGGTFVQVPLKDDKVSEGDESFTFRITNVSNGTLDTRSRDGDWHHPSTTTDTSGGLPSLRHSAAVTQRDAAEEGREVTAGAPRRRLRGPVATRVLERPVTRLWPL
jgi:hypothetical protein